MTNLYIIGGFLGAGKTSLILTLAKKLLAQGRKVGIVTNDQSSDLVDTNFLISNGLSVLAVEGSCFCCSFDEFTRKVAEQRGSAGAEVILCEPVGSCTDLVATIFKPLSGGRSNILSDFADNFRLAPLVVTIDIKRLLKFMKNEKSGEPLTEVNYLFAKQIEEAGIISIGKCDLFDREQIDEGKAYLTQRFKGAKVIETSAVHGTNIDELLANLGEARFVQSAPSLEIDYERYGAAEAELGWYNMSCRLLTLENAPDINEVMLTYMRETEKRLAAGSVIAHLKCYAVAGDGYFKASLTENGGKIDVSECIKNLSGEYNIIVNARIKSSPEDLRVACRGAANAAFRYFEMDSVSENCFSPAKPNPTHRI